MFENLLSHLLLTFSCYDFNTFGVCHGRNPRYPNENSSLKPSNECPKYVERPIFHYPIGFQKLFMFENLPSSFIVDIFVLRFQYFRSVPRSKSALPKRKFNFKTFKRVSIIRREANIPLPYRIFKVIHVLKSTFTFIVDIFVLRFQYFRSVPRSISALPKRKFNFQTF
jgi:hypothetical protein